MVQHALSAWHDVNGVILHLGAGECRELTDYLATRAERIVLVEPDPELAHALRQRVSQEPRVTIIEAAVAETSGKRTLHRFNTPGLATLNPLEQPPLRWPGLREIESVEVRVINLSELMNQVGLQQEQVHWLIIDCPGEEETVIWALGKKENTFRYVSLHTGSMMPENEQAWPRLRKSLHQAGYCLEDITGHGDDRTYHASMAILSCLSSQFQEGVKEREKLIKLLEEEKKIRLRRESDCVELQQDKEVLLSKNELMKQEIDRAVAQLSYIDDRLD